MKDDHCVIDEMIEEEGMIRILMIMRDKFSE
jgi:hypothetical protein